MKYFVDTYAIIEIIKGNEKYEKYVGEELCTTIYNLYELYYNLLREEGEEVAKNQFLRWKHIIISFTEQEIFQASRFKAQYKKRKLSYADALGYAVAQAQSILFLTGDQQFSDIKGVEFVKK